MCWLKKGCGDDEGFGGDHGRCVGEKDGFGWWCWGERELFWSDVHGPGGRVGVEWIGLVDMMVLGSMI